MPFFSSSSIFEVNIFLCRISLFDKNERCENFTINWRRYCIAALWFSDELFTLFRGFSLRIRCKNHEITSLWATGLCTAVHWMNGRVSLECKEYGIFNAVSQCQCQCQCPWQCCLFFFTCKLSTIQSESLFLLLLLSTQRRQEFSSLIIIIELNVGIYLLFPFFFCAQVLLALIKHACAKAA